MAKTQFDNHPATGSATGDDADPRLEQIREILFGDQTREVEQRFARIEELLERQHAALSQALDRRLATLEQDLRRSLDDLSAALQDERVQRARDQGVLGSRVAQLDADSDDRQSSLRREVEQSLVAIEERLGAGQVELRQALETQLQQVRGDTLARAALADLMQELAARLRQSPGE